SEQILEIIKANGGFLDVTDKTAPDRIAELFGMSKRNFKQALGSLYKDRLVVLEEEGVRVIEK
ncbi:MAG TPA: hypothetical protein VKY45_05740, partial [Marinilabiliaceae bacterium]|nr:hypothetical protein [Marinilabiliaceae bacterium]